MASFIIPTIFTAINRFSGPANQVAASMQGVASTAGRAQVALSTFSPLVDKTTTGLLSFAKSAVLIGGILGGITFSAKSIIDYDKAVAKFRIVVDDLSDADFSKFKFAIKDVADATKSSMVDVANAFEAIAQISPEFAKTPAMISATSTAAITLGRAANMELKPAAEALAKIMNQNNLSADQAMRTANVLAASAAIGASSIADVAEAYKNFGSVGTAANMTIEQSNAALQVLAKGGVDAATAGTKLKRSILELQGAGVGWKTGKFNFIEALETVRDRMKALGNDMARSGYMKSIFGMEGVEAGTSLINRIDLIKEYEKAVTGTNEANIQAAITTGTMAFRLTALSNAFQNVIIDSNSATIFGMAFNTAIGFLTNNMNALLNVATLILVPMLAIKGALMAAAFAGRVATASIMAWNFAVGVSAALAGESALALARSSAALMGYNLAANGAAIATKLFNAAIASAPALFGIALIALAAYTIYTQATKKKTIELADANKELGDSYTKLKKPITEAQLALSKLNDIRNLRTEALDIGTKIDYNKAHGIGTRLLEGKLFSKNKEFSSAISEGGLKDVFSSEAALKNYSDSLVSRIRSDDSVSAVESSGRNPATDMRNMTNVAAPNVSVNVIVNKDGTIETTTNMLRPKDTVSTSKYPNP